MQSFPKAAPPEPQQEEGLCPATTQAVRLFHLQIQWDYPDFSLPGADGDEDSSDFDSDIGLEKLATTPEYLENCGRLTYGARWEAPLGSAPGATGGAESGAGAARSVATGRLRMALCLSEGRCC